MAGLGEIVTERRPERPGEDVGDPERRNRIEPEAEVRDRDSRDRRGEEDDRPGIADVEALRRQVTGRGPEREREEDGRPVERLAAGRVDRVDRERPLATRPRWRRRSRAGC